MRLIININRGNNKEERGFEEWMTKLQEALESQMPMQLIL